MGYFCQANRQIVFAKALFSLVKYRKYVALFGLISLLFYSVFVVRYSMSTFDIQDSPFLKRERRQIVFVKATFSLVKYQKYLILFGLILAAYLPPPTPAYSYQLTLLNITSKQIGTIVKKIKFSHNIFFART
jgi:hypothetical protein